MIREDPSFSSYLAEKLGANELCITGEWQNIQGWSMETFSLDLKYFKDGKPVEQEIVLRREPIGGLLEPYDVSVEYKVLSALQDTDITIPKTYWYEPDPTVFERPFYAMEKVEGEVITIPARAQEDVFNDEAQRAGLADDFMSNIIALHTCDWKSRGLDFLGVPCPGKGSALAQVEYWENVIDRAGYRNHPLVALSTNWLKEHAPENETVVIVHGDYRTGNYISEGDRIKAILDWEMVHLGDPLEDLAYIFISVFRSPPPYNRISHLISEEEFIKRYEAGTGITVDREKLRYYDVLIGYKATGIASTAAYSFATKVNPDIRPGVFGQTIDKYLALLAQALNVQLGG